MHYLHLDKDSLPDYSDEQMSACAISQLFDKPNMSIKSRDILIVLLWLAAVCSANGYQRKGEDKEQAIRAFISSNGDVGLIRRSTPFEEFVATTLQRSSRSCKCKCRSRFYKEGWYCCTCTWTQKSCFPGHAMVTSEDGSKIKMSELKRGDKVLTASADGQISSTTVRAFMQRNTTGFGLYLTLHTEYGPSITLSKSHLIYASKLASPPHAEFSYTYAGELSLGDLIVARINGTMVRMPIIKIEKQAAEGAYTPLTDTGTILVDGILSSCYAAFHHRLAHLFMSPLRWFPEYLEPEPEAEGMRDYVRALRDLGRWLLPGGLHDESSGLLRSFDSLEALFLSTMGLGS